MPLSEQYDKSTDAPGENPLFFCRQIQMNNTKPGKF